MKIRWTKRSLRDLASVHAYISRESPNSAARVAAAILSAAEQLKPFPQSGRPGRLKVTRELLVHGLPYILPYRVRKDTIDILAVLHTSRKWPVKL